MLKRKEASRSEDFGLRSSPLGVGKNKSREAGFFFSKLMLVVLAAVLVLLSASLLYAQDKALSAEVLNLLGTLRGTAAQTAMTAGETPEPPRFAVAEDGYVTHIGAPPSSYFPVSIVVPGNAAETARNFLMDNRNVFGARSAAVDFRSMKSRKKDGRSYERFQQTYRGIPVFSGEVIVQLNETGGVEYVLSDISRNTSLLDDGMIPVVPSISSGEALRKARDLFSEIRPGVKLETTVPVLKIFDSSVIDDTKEMHLVWEFIIEGEDAGVNEQVLFDAHTGELVRDYTLTREALSRLVYDSNNTTADPGTLKRIEGGGASTIADVNDVYDRLGGIYNFYMTYFSRDGIDGAGQPVVDATVRYCDPGSSCPWGNAMSWKSRFYFGSGYTADDCVGHEYTHAVTGKESNLVYANQSGAMNESFSDIFGEFYDLTDGTGTDTAAVRWLIGEDDPVTWRSMQNPPDHNQPDRFSNYVGCNGQSPADSNDQCWVHTNSGIGNKLAYLLTDGDTFNGYTVSGMGITSVARLFYEAQANILTSGATYYDLHWALRQAAINLGWSMAPRTNLYNACLAVEIVGFYWPIYISTAGNDTTGNGSTDAPFRTVTKGNQLAQPGDGLWIGNGSYNETLVFDKIMTIQLWGSGSAVIGSP